MDAGAGRRELDRVWNREITLDGAALPAGITVGGSKLLAAPRTLRWKERRYGDETRRGTSQPQQVQASPTGATYRGTLHAGAFELTVVNQTEYDGCTKMSLAVAAAAPAGGNNAD